MHKQALSIYVVKAVLDEDVGRPQWHVKRWTQPPVLLPRDLISQVISTTSGDVEVYMPYEATRDRNVWMWAHAEIRRLHPKPTDLETLDTLTLAEQFRLGLDMALEYVEIAEDGRGHNERSHYLSRCLRQIGRIISNPVCSTASLNSGAPASFDSKGEQDEQA